MLRQASALCSKVLGSGAWQVKYQWFELQLSSVTAACPLMDEAQRRSPSWRARLMPSLSVASGMLSEYTAPQQ
jgi:hypothetical protein